jgi:hypothetical protein
VCMYGLRCIVCVCAEMFFIFRDILLSCVCVCVREREREREREKRTRMHTGHAEEFMQYQRLV